MGASQSTEVELKYVQGGDQREVVRIPWQKGSQPASPNPSSAGQKENTHIVWGNSEAS